MPASPRPRAWSPRFWPQAALHRGGPGARPPRHGRRHRRHARGARGPPRRRPFAARRAGGSRAPRADQAQPRAVAGAARPPRPHPCRHAPLGPRPAARRPRPARGPPAGGEPQRPDDPLRRRSRGWGRRRRRRRLPPAPPRATGRSGRSPAPPRPPSSPLRCATSSRTPWPPRARGPRSSWRCTPGRRAAGRRGCDRGPGIPANELPHVNGRFVCGRDTQGPGSGLGLALAPLAAERLGGRLALASAPAVGS